MKIVIFSDEKEIIEVQEKVINPQIYSTEEVIWEYGSFPNIEHNYVILNDDEEFENVTDEELIKQYKEQVIYTIARIFERDRVDYLVKGVLEQAQINFEKDKIDVQNLTTKEEVSEKLFMVKNRKY